MKERIVRLEVGPYPKKYTAVLQNKVTGRFRRVHFGDQRYEQYRDRTRLGVYSDRNHNDIKRMRSYYSRHSGVKTRKAGIDKERNRAKETGLYTAKLLSHMYLW